MELNVRFSSTKRNSDGDEEHSPKKLKNIVIKNDSDVEVRLLNDAFKIIRRKLEVTDEEMETGLSTVTGNFIYQSWNSGKWAIDFTKNENLCAYFYKLFALGVGLTREKSILAINGCEELKTILMTKNELNIISIGGGPGSDLIGFCSAIHGIVGTKMINFTIADQLVRFASCFNVLEFLVREGDYGKISNFYQRNDISTVFRRVDLTNISACDKKFLKDLKNSDIILMKSLLSILDTIEVPDVIELIQHYMKAGALLIHIDSPLEDFDKLEEIYSTANLRNDFYFTGDTSNLKWPISKNSKAKISVFIKRSQNHQ